jgi:hypothetical protein
MADSLKLSELHQKLKHVQLLISNPTLTTAGNMLGEVIENLEHEIENEDPEQ